MCKGEVWGALAMRGSLVATSRLVQGLGERSVLNGMWGKYDHHRHLES